MPFERERLKQRLANLATKGVYVGTSSWKYEGWFGQIYTPARYEFRGKVAATRFKRDCLSEYAEVFKTVCLDSTYYTFPDSKNLTGLASQVPSDFQFGFKVTGEITVKKFPNHARHGARAGKLNENFLNADLFARAFLQPCEAIRPNVGVVMFEFSRFYKSDFAHGRDFVAALDTFLDLLPKGWPYGIEMRNDHWLAPEYFACLAKHRVSHVFNSWEHMPPVEEQMAQPGSRTNPRLVAARFLLKPGRRYDEAVDEFLPYERVQEPYPEARAAGKALIAESMAAGPERKTFIYVNNRLEGNAPETIEAMTEAEYFRVMKGFDGSRSS